MTLNSTAYDWKTLEATAEEPICITTEADLQRYCEYWRTLPFIALDTEFIRVETFYPIAGLFQVADDKSCYLIDPTTIEDFSALVSVFKDPSVLKVMHAASEDLELFLHTPDVLPQPLFDTQTGAALLNWGFSMGLQRMLEQKLDIRLEKHETTSDWLQRPLTSSQEKYAALDVAYLPALYEMQRVELEEKGATSWAEEENQSMLDGAVDTDPEGHEYYTRFTQMWRYPEHKVAALRDLSAWREQEARLRDVPRNRILRNQGLLQIIEKWPTTLGQMSSLDEIRKRILRQDGETILAILKGGQRSAQEHLPIPIDQPLHFFWNKHLKKLKGIARSAAEEQNVAPEVMLRRKELEALVRSGVEGGEYQLPDNMSAWRQELIGPALLAELEQIEKLRS